MFITKYLYSDYRKIKKFFVVAFLLILYLHIIAYKLVNNQFMDF